MNLLDILEIIGGVVGMVAIFIVIWDHFKDDRQLTRQVQGFYDDIEHLLYSFYQKWSTQPRDFLKKKLYYEGKVRQNFEKYSNYLGLALVEEVEKFYYYSRSDYLMQVSGEFYSREPETDLTRVKPRDSNFLDSVSEFLRDLRGYWKQFFQNALFRRKIDQKLDFSQLRFP